MSTFHINQTSGEVGPCRAVQGKCPFGSAQDHYPSLVAAAVAYESMMSAATVPMPVSQTQDSWHWNARTGGPAHCVSKGCPIGDVPHYATHADAVRAQIPHWSKLLSEGSLRGSDLTQAVSHVALDDPFRPALYSHVFAKGTKRHLDAALFHFGESMGEARSKGEQFQPDAQHIEALNVAVKKAFFLDSRTPRGLIAALPRFPHTIDFLADNNIMAADEAERAVACNSYMFSHYPAEGVEPESHAESILDVVERHYADPELSLEALKQLHWNVELMSNNSFYSRGYYGDNKAPFEARFNSLKSKVNSALKKMEAGAR